MLGVICVSFALVREVLVGPRGRPSRADVRQNAARAKVAENAIDSMELMSFEVVTRGGSLPAGRRLEGVGEGCSGRVREKSNDTHAM